MKPPITFNDDHEAELWRACVECMMPALYANKEIEDVPEEAALFADDAVLEYRKRCGPSVMPESVDSFIRQAVNFADTVGSRATDDSIRGRASKLIENGERLLAEGDDQ